MSEKKPVGLHEEGVEVPYEQLEPEILQNLIQEFSPYVPGRLPPFNAIQRQVIIFAVSDFRSKTTLACLFRSCRMT